MRRDTEITRKDALRLLLLAAGSAAMPVAEAIQNAPQTSGLTIEDLKGFCRVCNLQFSDDELKALLPSANSELSDINAVRNAVGQRQINMPLAYRRADSFSVQSPKVSVRPASIQLPDVSKLSDEDIAYLSVNQLSHLIKAKKITSVRLTKIYLDRLERYGTKLLCVITMTRDRAMAAAEKADKEIASGKYRGPLHGIPYGIKDLFAVKGYPTTYGAEPYVDQISDEDCEIVRRLDEAGAVLLAKLSLGALAMNDHWFKGRTKNPWNMAQGSSGSSAGSASATASGLVAFSIGTETQGSIVSPSNQCRVTGLRPSYGRVSRRGGMELSFTMDKPGPICRSAEDCAIVLSAICGADPEDPATYNQNYEYRSRSNAKGLKIGYLSSPTNMENDTAVRILRDEGATVTPTKLSSAMAGTDCILVVEGASAFEELTRSGRVNEIQQSMWPQIFRASRFITGVDYLQAQRLRTDMAKKFEDEFGDYDAMLGDGIIAANLSLTNLIGTPQIIIPWGVNDRGGPLSKSFLGKMWQEAKIAAIADLVQRNAGYHRLRPKLS